MRRARPLLGTFVAISVESAPDETAAQDALHEAFGAAARIEHRLSAHTPDSELAAIVSTAHLRPVTASPDCLAVLATALALAEASGGAFDPVRAGVRLVGAGRRPRFAGVPPDAEADWRDLLIQGETVVATRPLHLDLGGVAKGFAADLAAAALASYGCRGVVNAGGDLAFTDTGPRDIVLRAPGDDLRPAHTFTGVVAKAVATSGAHGPLADGGRDLVHPHSGHAASANLSVSVFAASCAVADALTKVVLFADRATALRCLRERDATAVVIRSDGDVTELY